MNPKTINEKDIELIERYIDGDLPPEEADQFEQRIKEDTGFSDILKLRQELPEIWKDARRQSLIREELEKKLSPGKIEPFRNSYILAAAASFLILIGVFFLYQSKVSQEGYFSSRHSKVTAPEQAPYSGDSGLVERQEGKESAILEPATNTTRGTNETISFRWRFTQKPVENAITIREIGSQRLVYYQKLPSGQNFFTLQPHVLKPGRYEWFSLPETSPGTFTIQP